MSETTQSFEFVACEVSIWPPTTLPTWFLRTVPLASLAGRIIGGVACLFGFDCKFWCWSSEKGFRPIILTKWERVGK